MRLSIFVIVLGLGFSTASFGADVRSRLTELARISPARADRAQAALALGALTAGRAAEARDHLAALEARRAKMQGYALGYTQGYSDGLAGRYVDHRPTHGQPELDQFYRGYEDGWSEASFPRP